MTRETILRKLRTLERDWRAYDNVPVYLLTRLIREIQQDSIKKPASVPVEPLFGPDYIQISPLLHRSTGSLNFPPQQENAFGEPLRIKIGKNGGRHEHGS